MDKPAFDPTQSFESSKPAFDPSQSFDSGQKSTPVLDALKSAGKYAWDTAKDLPGDANAALTGAADGVTFGYLPQIQGAVGSGISAIQDAASGQMPTGDSIKRDYLGARDQEIKRQADIHKNYPVSNTLGEIGGAIAAPIPGLGEFSAASTGGKVVQSALKGGAYGGLMNPGDKPQTIDPVQLNQRLGAAVLGLPLGVAGEGLASALEKSPDTLQSLRRYLTGKELGANKGQMKQLLRELPGGGGTDRLDRMESFLNNNDLLGKGKTFSDIADQTKIIRDQTGQQIGQTYGQVQNDVANAAQKNPDVMAKLNQTALNGPDLASEFLKREKDQLKGVHGGESAYNTISRDLGNPDNPIGLSALGQNASIPDLVNYRASVDDRVGWNKRMSEMPEEQKSLVRLRSFLNDKVENRISALDQQVGGDNVQRLKKLNADYADASLASKITDATKAGEMSRNPFGLINGIAAAGVGGWDLSHGGNPAEALAKAAAVGVGGRALRAYGPGLSYSVARSLQGPAERAAAALENSSVGSRVFTNPWMELTKDNR